ncbi:hypothetical protein [Frateuria soli]|uniref:hypothetical protein n=1 Tax=Frateuria soli TaxID=1542730 RepID=UPI001E3B78A4|nr:hypothetical protein [Frateuria soli]UGB39717.1 hypothetical protein LQ771_07780 [Frateuria soli]
MSVGRPRVFASRIIGGAGSAFLTREAHRATWGHVRTLYGDDPPEGIMDAVSAAVARYLADEAALGSDASWGLAEVVNDARAIAKLCRDLAAEVPAAVERLTENARVPSRTDERLVSLADRTGKAVRLHFPSELAGVEVDALLERVRPLLSRPMLWPQAPTFPDDLRRLADLCEAWVVTAARAEQEAGRARTKRPLVARQWLIRALQDVLVRWPPPPPHNYPAAGEGFICDVLEVAGAPVPRKLESDRAADKDADIAGRIKALLKGR